MAQFGNSLSIASLEDFFETAHFFLLIQNDSIAWYSPMVTTFNVHNYGYNIHNIFAFSKMALKAYNF